ncbi:diguanylate cyclase [Cellulomonas fimi]|uniref:GGDEF domain-containing protein n=1 Tax=Cellulomonas fimi TaxID=1708 RepID=A0A7Y0QHP7_CELFI|nr:GGDEF domain-containing protein [Cellulomonas fimi]NMR20388.1 GGDEF domain-containing protein [Cellulomonas fimi]
MDDDRSALVLHVAEFGPFDQLADLAHGLYVDGDNARAVQLCREGLAVSRAAGDVATTRFLLYVQGVALQDGGRHPEAVAVALELLAELEAAPPDTAWRAKALGLLAEASNRNQEIGRAMDALAEAVHLMAYVRPGTYSHLSTSMAIALALRSVHLLEQSDEMFRGIRASHDSDVDVLVVQELALLSTFWGTTLQLVGRGAEGRAHFVRAAERALRMARIARLAGNGSMVARAEVIEAYALARLGQVELAAARVEDAMRRFTFRAELVESHLARLVLAASASAAGGYDEARAQLAHVLERAPDAGRDVWVEAATEALADVHVAEHGNHPAVDVLRRLGRAALDQLWNERDGRFLALQAHNRVRELTVTTDRIGRDVLRDPLTGLGNRRLLAQAIDEATEDAAAIFVDVDTFKQVNDHYSHAVGDEVLRRLAVILRAQTRGGDVVVRYGGDEFVILVQGGWAAAAEVASRLHHAVRVAPWHEVAAGLGVTVSVGVGRSALGRGAVAAADSALYSAKSAGRDRVVVG